MYGLNIDSKELDLNISQSCFGKSQFMFTSLIKVDNIRLINIMGNC